MRSIQDHFLAMTGLYPPGLEPVTPLTGTAVEAARLEVAKNAWSVFQKGWNAALLNVKHQADMEKQVQDELPQDAKLCPDCYANMGKGPVSSDCEIKCPTCDGDFVGVWDEEGEEWYWA